MPICSCGVVPLGVGLVRSGAAVGTTLAFMQSAPAISPVAVLLAWNILGPPSSRYSDLRRSVRLRKAPRGPHDRPVTARLRSAGRCAFWDFGADVSVDLLVGLSIAAALVAAIPPEWVRSSLGQPGLASLLAAVGAPGRPAYTCTVPSILVRSLLLLGVSPGAALVPTVAVGPMGRCR